LEWRLRERSVLFPKWEIPHRREERVVGNWAAVAGQSCRAVDGDTDNPANLAGKVFLQNWELRSDVT